MQTFIYYKRPQFTLSLGKFRGIHKKASQMKKERKVNDCLVDEHLNVFFLSLFWNRELMEYFVYQTGIIVIV